MAHSNPSSIISGENESRNQMTILNEILEVRAVWKLQKEIYEMKTKKREEMLRLKREELYKSFQHCSEIIESVSSDFQYVVENMPHIQKICNTQIGENSLPLSLHLHENTVALFKTIADICNNYEHIAKTLSKARHIDFCKSFKKLFEAVYNKDFKIVQQEIIVVEKCLDTLKSKAEEDDTLSYNKSYGI